MIKKLLALTLAFVLASPIFLVAPAWAAITILDVAASNEAEDCDPCNPLSITISAGTSRKTVCGIAAEDATNYNLSGVTIGGVAAQLAIAGESPTDNNIGEIFYLDLGSDNSVLSPGVHAVSADFTESVLEFGITCITLAGIAQGAPKATNPSVSDSLNTATLTLVGVLSTDWTFTLATINNTANTFSHGSGQNELSDFEFGATPSATMSMSYEAGEAAPQSTFGGSANRWVMVGAVWAEAASTAVPVQVIIVE